MKMAMISIFLLFINPAVQNEDLTIVHEGKEIMNIYRDDYMEEFIGKPFISSSKTNELMNQVSEVVHKEAINAKIGNSGEIIPGENGYHLYQEKFQGMFYSYLLGKGPMTMEAPKLPIHPKVDSEILANIRTKQIGQYVTYFNSNNKERTHNIKLATDAVDSHVVFPGETFSFNQVVGKRTKEKGYLPAPVIVKGEVTEGIGGGICQVSSTIFNAVDNAGANILQRFSHSKSVPYVPPGRDATVSWYGPDFTFKNPYNQPLLIRAKVYGGQLSITIFSSNEAEVKNRDIPDASEELPDEVKLEEDE
ncbi:VanW family protein [Pontibacillus yanchengensis]|uniref:Peptidoglycan binding domain-containing protein n=1 Tax=Pontibacillus yanchengensis Y32 TaxID=1385514 RepID=A0A0A2TDC2_9BACI|nr:VanW family protein [Pontibacillus yanchengensis]KGP72398.1 hypothetical protein N782_12125 [Pontibacillus yanchengensis Y32]